MIPNKCGISVKWEQSDENAANTIVGYNVEVKSVNGTFLNFPFCMIKDAAQTFCDVQMNHLQKEPFYLQDEETITVRVQAKNFIGVGAFSDEVVYAPSKAEMKFHEKLFPNIGNPVEE